MFWNKRVNYFEKILYGIIGLNIKESIYFLISNLFPLFLGKGVLEGRFFCSAAVEGLCQFWPICWLTIRTCLCSSFGETFRQQLLALLLLLAGGKGFIIWIFEDVHWFLTIRLMNIIIFHTFNYFRDSKIVGSDI